MISYAVFCLKKTKEPKEKKRFTKEKKNFDLPTVKTVPSENLNDYSFLCYGRKKIGKTSLFGRREKTLFFLFEPGAKSQSIYKVPKDGDCFIDWDDVIGYAKKLSSPVRYVALKNKTAQQYNSR